MTSPMISVSELSEQLHSPVPPAVLDASLELHAADFDGDYRKTSGHARWVGGHIAGSQHVDLSVQFCDPDAGYHYAHPSPQAVADELARIGVAHGRGVVVYDSTGTLFASRLWYLLRWIGVEVRVLDGGYRAWVAAGNPVVEGDEKPPAPVPSWKASAVRSAWISKAELIDREASDPRSLVCSLPAAQFTGSAPSRYARRGHIPGSLNVSSRDHFDTDGGLKSRVELALAYDSADVDLSKEVLLYCGGGISAAAGALALATAGVSAMRIYDGSLEEWAADDELPLDVG